MASRQGRVARVKLHASERIVVTCEHASNALPRGIGQVGASAAALRSHAAWDRGSREVASILAHRLGAAHFAGRYTRLLVDLNRSRGSKSLIPKERSGYSIAGNRKLSRKDREERIEKYYTPYREVVEAAVREALAAEGMCLHLSVHTFVPALDDEGRHADVGVLYDPRRTKERGFAERMRDALVALNVPTRLNYPHSGTSDAFTTHLRARFPKTRYLGIQIEVNQDALRTNRSVWQMGRLITEAVAAAIEV
jgi:predicted N-formylglutamate amidohydrolase